MGRKTEKELELMTKKFNPANLVKTYFDEPDTTSHLKGLFSAAVEEIISAVDSIVRYLLDKLKDIQLCNRNKQ